jgi:nucleotide-binding universal stress UspA family protein
MQITQGMLREIHVPVLTICRATRPLAFKRILFATDLSDSSKQGFDFALEIARTMGSDVVVLHALDKVRLTYGAGEIVDYDSVYDIEQARSRLTEIVSEADRQKAKNRDPAA